MVVFKQKIATTFVDHFVREVRDTRVYLVLLGSSHGDDAQMRKPLEDQLSEMLISVNHCQ
jgi:hypothetical protein